MSPDLVAQKKRWAGFNSEQELQTFLTNKKEETKDDIYNIMTDHTEGDYKDCKRIITVLFLPNKSNLYMIRYRILIKIAKHIRGQ